MSILLFIIHLWLDLLFGIDKLFIFIRDKSDKNPRREKLIIH